MQSEAEAHPIIATAELLGHLGNLPQVEFMSETIGQKVETVVLAELVQEEDLADLMEVMVLEPVQILTVDWVKVLLPGNLEKVLEDYMLAAEVLLAEGLAKVAAEKPNKMAQPIPEAEEEVTGPPKEARNLYMLAALESSLSETLDRRCQVWQKQWL